MDDRAHIQYGVAYDVIKTKTTYDKAADHAVVKVVDVETVRLGCFVDAQSAQALLTQLRKEGKENVRPIYRSVSAWLEAHRG